jgi:hypothetical protein
MVLVPPGFADRLADGQHDEVAGFDTPARAGCCSASRSSSSRSWPCSFISSGMTSRYSAHAVAAAGATSRRQRVDRHAAVEARHPQRGRARLRERGDGLDLEVEGGEQRRHGDRLVDAGEHAVEEVAVERRLGGLLGFDADAAMASTVSTGYLPAAVSAESITASVPSSTALATSETSARVGTGLWIIDSIICVAVMASLLCSRAMRIMRFCSAGTAASPTSTARSPRATMMPSEASGCPRGWRSPRRARSWRSAAHAAGGAQQLARHVHVGAGLGEGHRDEVGLEAQAAVLMSSMSLAVSAGAVRPPPWRLMPLLFDSSPAVTRGVDSRAVDAVDVEHGCGRRRAAARRPGFTSSAAPCSRGRRASASPSFALGVEDEGGAHLEGDACRRRTCRRGSSGPAGRP